MKQKHFMDIENLREFDSEIRKNNAEIFQVNDLIQISEKYDGSNACACFDKEENKMVAFSRKKELDSNNTLNGFYDFVVQLSNETIDVFKEYPNYRVFGEWSNKNKLVYFDTNKVKHWYVYDIYDVSNEKWVEQSIVKDFCRKANLEYIHILYEGKFISWEHCREFLNSPNYGEKQEGIVVKNQSKLNTLDSRNPFYLKIVNKEFAESMSKSKRKVLSQEEKEEKDRLLKLCESIVTRNRVEKMIYKLRDEGIYPNKLQPSDMKLVSQTLSKSIYKDCVKEEKEIVDMCGDSFGKNCHLITMKYARDIILE